MFMRSLIVNKNYNEKILERVLLENFTGLTKNNLYKALRKKDIKINGVRTNKNVLVHTGDLIEVYIVDDLLYNTYKNSLQIVYEDNFIILVNKPSEIEVTGENSIHTLLEKQYSFKVYPCHRLDRNTTGLVLFAKTEEALSVLLKKFQNGEIEKHYACHVYSIPKDKSKTLNGYLFKDSKKSVVYISDIPKKGYKTIITSYTVLQEFNDNTAILDINLHTGRTHQIRAHLAHIGYPIIGDGKYGINDINKKYHTQFQRLCSYKMKFCFKEDTTILNYLNNKEFNIDYKF